MLRPESPLELVRGRPQEASDVHARYAGSDAPANADRSPWYVGGQYVANASTAAILRQRESTRVASGHLQTLAYCARLARGHRFSCLGELRAVVQAEVTRQLGAPPVPSLAVRLARATFAMWQAIRETQAQSPRAAA